MFKSTLFAFWLSKSYSEQFQNFSDPKFAVKNFVVPFLWQQKAFEKKLGAIALNYSEHFDCEKLVFTENENVDAGIRL